MILTLVRDWILQCVSGSSICMCIFFTGRAAIWITLSIFLGVLTKADLVEKNCERKVMELLSNRKIRLKLGYCIVRCRNATEQGISHAKAINQEKEFFANHTQFKWVSIGAQSKFSLFLTRYTFERVDGRNNQTYYIPVLTSQKSFWKILIFRDCSTRSKFSCGPILSYKLRR